MVRRKQDIASLTNAEQLDVAFQKIVRSAAVCEQSSIKMRTKLDSAGFCMPVIEAALEKAQRFGVIDDRRYAECLVRHTLSLGKGMAKTECEIEQLGIDPFSLEAYVDYMACGEEAQVQSALKILELHPPRSKNPRNSAFNALLRKGFSKSVSSKAVSEWWNSFDTV